FAPVTAWQNEHVMPSRTRGSSVLVDFVTSVVGAWQLRHMARSRGGTAGSAEEKPGLVRARAWTDSDQLAWMSLWQPLQISALVKPPGVSIEREGSFPVAPFEGAAGTAPVTR